MNFDDAENYCISMGYHLASIHSAFENSFIQKTGAIDFGTVNGLIRIGLNTTNKFDWYWTDQSQFDYWNWEPGEPSGYEYCASLEINDGNWRAYPCNNAQNFVCAGNSTTRSTSQPQKSSTQQLKTTSPTSICSSASQYYNKTKKCYSFKQYPENFDPYTFNFNASIHSDDENYFVLGISLDILTENDCLPTNTVVFDYVIGDIRFIQNKWYWGDNTPLDYYANTMNYRATDGWDIVYARYDQAARNLSWYTLHQLRPDQAMPESCTYSLDIQPSNY
ncbi:hypothetical protein WR25_25343 isoform B [Diploscapter pachys]|nr:hypothetical protein WR25_25343 isoform B [Diploscapter pachys]